MRPKDPHSRPRLHLAEEADEDDLIFACASCGCSSCIYYWDVEDQRTATSATAFRSARWRHASAHAHRPMRR